MSELEGPRQSGPCVVCGATNYALSMGGPTICPSCDCGPPKPRDVRLLREAYQTNFGELARERAGHEETRRRLEAAQEAAVSIAADKHAAEAALKDEHEHLEFHVATSKRQGERILELESALEQARRELAAVVQGMKGVHDELEGFLPYEEDIGLQPVMWAVDRLEELILAPILAPSRPASEPTRAEQHTEKMRERAAWRQEVGIDRPASEPAEHCGKQPGDCEAHCTWSCAACRYHNSGPVCTHCGTPRPAPPASVAEQAQEKLRASDIPKRFDPETGMWSYAPPAKPSEGDEA